MVGRAARGGAYRRVISIAAIDLDQATSVAAGGVCQKIDETGLCAGRIALATGGSSAPRPPATRPNNKKQSRITPAPLDFAEDRSIINVAVNAILSFNDN